MYISIAKECIASLRVVSHQALHHHCRKRGLNAYKSEVLVISDLDGEGISVVVNQLYK